MKNSKKITVVVTGAILVVALVILGFTMMSSNDAQKVFEAQMEAIHGDNGDIESLGFEKNYAAQATTALADSGLSINEHQYDAATSALENFTYKVVDVNEIDENTFDVVYEIDSYPIVNSMLVYFENPGDYLTDEEMIIFDSANYEDEKFVDVQKKLMAQYHADLPNIKPERVTGTVRYVYSEDESNFVLENEEYFDDLVKTILGVSNIPKDVVE